MPITLDGTLGITTPSYGGADAAEYLVPVTAFKNRIINGAMVFDQRNTGAAVNSNSAVNPYTLDRWRSVVTSGSGQFSIQQNAGSVTPPAGFVNYLGVTSLAATTVGTDFYAVRQPIEGVNTADFAWGTASAQTVTLSFWVRSSLTGTFGGSLQNSANNRSYPFTYTINSANTWEFETITVPGDTTGTWTTGTAAPGIDLFFNLGAGGTFVGTPNTWGSGNFKAPTGAVSVVATNGATFYITGVQLEVGSNATSFDYRPYGTELALCQRYYQKTFPPSTVPANNTGNDGAFMGMGLMSSNSEPVANWYLPVQLRAAPSVTLFNPGSGTSGQWGNGANTGGAARVIRNTANLITIDNSGVLLNSGVQWNIQAVASAEL